MITLDQILTLQEKVESAVKKIEQLTAENAALRSKCVELTNALSAKTEQFSSFEADQSKIENGLLKALERLNAVENAVLNAASQVAKESQQPQMAVQNPVQPSSPAPQQAAPSAAPVNPNPAPAAHTESFPQIPTDSADNSSEADMIEDPFPDTSANQDNSQGQFEIF